MACSSSDITYEDAVKTVQRWATIGSSDEEKLQFLNETIKNLNEPKGSDMTEQDKTELATRAVETDEAFLHALEALSAFSSDHGGQYPDIIPFKNDWAVYKSSWNTALSQSADYARQTVPEYQGYMSKLQQVGKITTKEEMQKLAADLKQFATNKPINIPAKFKDVFLDLKRKMEDFQTKFNGYFFQQQASYNVSSGTIATNMQALKYDIADLNRQINEATSGLSVASWSGLLSFSPYLEILLAARKRV